jgi:hypothetical protein
LGVRARSPAEDLGEVLAFNVLAYLESVSTGHCDVEGLRHVGMLHI